MTLFNLTIVACRFFALYWLLAAIELPPINRPFYWGKLREQLTLIYEISDYNVWEEFFVIIRAMTKLQEKVKKATA